MNNTEARRLTTDEIAATIRDTELRALQKARVNLMIEQKFRSYHGTRAAEALAEIQRLRRKLGV